jgi:hypothetical protein
MQFNNPTSKNMTTLHLRNSIRSFLIPVALAVFALSPTVQALLPGPTPDGGYDGGNTAEGNGALFSVVISPLLYRDR